MTSTATATATAAPYQVSEADLVDLTVSGTRPLAFRLGEIIATWSRTHYELVTTAAEFADSHEWFLAGSPTPAAWLAATADIEQCTAREWIRIGRSLQGLSAVADAFKTGAISYSKVRTLTRVATRDNEHELLEIALTTPAGELTKALAAWRNRNSGPEELEAYQHQQRSVKWRTDPDGMVHFSMRLPPLVAGLLISFLTTWVMRSRPKGDSNQAWPSAAQQYADAIADMVDHGRPTADTKLVIHVRGQGCSLEDGTPVPDSAVAKLVHQAFISALVHDSDGAPIDATNRRRHPDRRQRRLINERDNHTCVDCGRTDLLEYDHNPPYTQTGHTITAETETRCSPCHTKRHSQ